MQPVAVLAMLQSVQFRALPLKVPPEGQGPPRSADQAMRIKSLQSFRTSFRSLEVLSSGQPACSLCKN